MKQQQPVYTATIAAPGANNTGHYVQGQQQRFVSPGAYQAQTNPARKSTIIALVVLGIVALIGIGIGIFFALQEEEENNRLSVIDLGDEERSGNNYVGLVFTVTNLASSDKAPFIKAAQKWSDVITANLITPETPLAQDETLFAEQSGLDFDIIFPAGFDFNHLVIIADVFNIDGAGGILAQAGPLIVEGGLGNLATGFPTVGFMQFDTGDFDSLNAQGTLDEVVLHEMGHVLGIGTLWGGRGRLINPVLVNGQDSGSDNPEFTGPAARSEFGTLRGSGDTNVPVENGIDEFGNLRFNPIESGGGSIDGHFRKTTFGNEIMTFSLGGAGGVHPLSRMTIASLGDLGYDVDLNEAESYSLPGNSDGLPLRSGAAASSDEVSLVGDILKFEILKYGNGVSFIEAARKRWPPSTPTDQ